MPEHPDEQPQEGVELGGIGTRSARMIQLLDRARRFATLDSPILIQGETGTGKELVARAVHALSPRAAKPLVVLDCAALPESLMESELFGHERGAFTGADRSYTGRIESASGGTLFLDEINSMSLAMQTKILRFLEEREICRIGQLRPVRVDARLIGASNVPLDQLVLEGRVRADFFYRLNVLRLDVPPLRERLEDLVLLARQFLAEDPVARQRGIDDVTEELLGRLRAHSWPGNVRELRNVLRRAVALAAHDGVLRAVDLATEPTAPSAPRADKRGPWPCFRLWMREREGEYLTQLVRRHKTPAQQALASGLPQRTLSRKLRSLGLSSGRACAAAGGLAPAERGRQVAAAGWP